MNKILITGAAGFVGHHLKSELLRAGYNVVTTDIVGEVDFCVDLLNLKQLINMITSVKPDAIVHLAGFSSVSKSWKNPQLTVELNVNATLNLLQVVKSNGYSTRILIIGSSDQYGTICSNNHKIDEDAYMNPLNPYAISKYTQERMATMMAKACGMDVVCTRSFNHIGPGQNKGFVVADFASALVAIEKGAKPIIEVGNIAVCRDFTDVRDIVIAYRLLLERGKSLSIYNVGSGNPYRIEDILKQLIQLSKVEHSVKVSVSMDKLRPIDVPTIYCDNKKLIADTGWTPLYPLDKSLEDTLEWWRQQ